MCLTSTYLFVLSEYFGDLSLALDPHPPPETPSASESLDLSIQDVDATGIGDQESVAGDPSRQSAVLTDLTNRGTPNQTESCYKTGGKPAFVLLIFLSLSLYLFICLSICMYVCVHTHAYIYV